MNTKDLDRLLHEALKQARANPKVATADRCQTPHQRYANPQNWIEGLLVELVYDDGLGMMSLGRFREFHYRLAPGGRKLVRTETDDSVEATIEFCYGEWWIQSRTPTVPDFADDEITIRERFIELLREFEE